MINCTGMTQGFITDITCPLLVNSEEICTPSTTVPSASWHQEVLVTVAGQRGGAGAKGGPGPRQVARWLVQAGSGLPFTHPVVLLRAWGVIPVPILPYQGTVLLLPAIGLPCLPIAGNQNRENRVEQSW